MPKWSNLRRIIPLALFSLFASCVFSLSNLLASQNRGGAEWTLIDTNPFPALNAFGLSPFWDWKTIETEHFRITFPVELKTIAVRSAELFEETHKVLSKELQWEANHKVQVVVVDNYDAANGLTSPAGRLGIVLWVTPPDSWFPTYYYDDWLKLLIVHEYTHYLNMDNHHGIWDIGRILTGPNGLPNSLWPPWMLEGLAVFMETKYTGAGRGRSTYFDTVLRSAVSEGVLGTADFMTLDKINGTNPYFPGGDTRYQFGYHLMNQIDRTQPTENGIFGKLSKDSGYRIPYFINGLLENNTGKDWYTVWDEWLADTKKRIAADLKKLNSYPTSHFETITDASYKVSNQVTGVAASLDGKWLAFNTASADRRQGLYLYDLSSKEFIRIDDKYYGPGLQFTPDSRTLIYSQVRQLGQYYYLSDLRAYDLESHSIYSLTDQLRAKDPDVSPDGMWITFTISRHGYTELTLARLQKSKDKVSIGSMEPVYTPSIYDLVANPKFSRDGKKIFFSLHKHGKSQVDLMELDLKKNQVTPLVSDGNYNRFPAVDLNGDLYFVSNLTGVDNLYKYDAITKRTVLATHLITGVNFPTFGPTKGSQSQLYGSIFSHAGANLAKIETLEKRIPTKEITISPPPAPKSKNDLIHDTGKEYEVTDYSIFPSIWPRIWTPFFYADPQDLNIGAQAWGFDTVDRHRYSIGASYHTQFTTADTYLLYSNRSFGPAFAITGSIFTNNQGNYDPPLRNLISYSRDYELTASVSYPFVWTYSSLTPSIGLDLQKQTYYVYGTNSNRSYSLGSTPSILSVDSSLTYQNLEYSPLAVTAEGGRLAQVALRVYPKLGNSGQSYKVLLYEEEHIRLAKHTVLIPSFKASWSSQASASYRKSSAYVLGRTTSDPLNVFPQNSLDSISVRGYPYKFFLPKLATVAAVNVTFPLLRIFRGLGTIPLFFDNLYGFAFAELGYIPINYFPGLGTSSLSNPNNIWLPSTGAGIRFSTEAFYAPVPIVLSGEWNQGFNKSQGGSADFFFKLLVQIGFQGIQNFQKSP